MSQDSVNAENEPRNLTEQTSTEPPLDSPVTSDPGADEMRSTAEIQAPPPPGPGDQSDADDRPDAIADTTEPLPASAVEHEQNTSEQDTAADDDDEDVADLPDEFDGDTSEDVKPIEESDTAEESVDAEKKWYILKVQSNREKSICAALSRRVKIEGLDEFFGEIIVPTEDVAEFKNGKRRVVKRKLYPGYIVVNMVLNEETWFVVRETPGIGDFTGSAGKPAPMLQEEIDRIVKAAHPEEEDSEQIKTAIPFKLGDRVRIKEGTFENFEGDVEVIDEASGHVTVVINIFNRSTPVELEHWQVESV